MFLSTRQFFTLSIVLMLALLIAQFSTKDTTRVYSEIANTNEEMPNYLIRSFGVGWVNAVAFSPDGNFAVFGGEASIASLIDINSGRIIRSYGEHTRKITSVAFSPDGTQILTGSDDATAQLWDVGTGEVIRTFIGHTYDVSSVVFSPDGMQILTGSS